MDCPCGRRVPIPDKTAMPIRMKIVVLTEVRILRIVPYRLAVSFLIIYKDA